MFVRSMTYIVIFVLGTLLEYIVDAWSSRLVLEKKQFCFVLRHWPVRMLTGGMSVMVVAKNGVTVLSLSIVLYSVILIIIGIVDWNTFVIPNQLNYSLVMIAILFLLQQSDISIEERVVGFFIISISMLVITLVYFGAFGGGDIKMIAVSGFILGSEQILIAWSISVLCCGMYVCYLLLMKKGTRKSKIQLGPFLSIGCYMGILYGHSIVKWLFHTSL
ncbi:MAG: A24 family peptidase [Eubacteriales bacterium]